MDNKRSSPGSVVKAAMEAKGWTQADLAYALGATTAYVNYILNDKRGISSAAARSLGAALDKDPAIFAIAQAEWDLLSADPPAADIAARAKILSHYPLREMVKRGWIDPEHGSGSLEEQVCKFFGVDSLDKVPHLAHSAKKKNYESVPASQLVWLYRVRKIAKEMSVHPFQHFKLRDAIEKMSELRADIDAVRYVPRLLADAGVRLVVVEGLPESKIDGACFWLDDQSPVIGLSFRYDRVDNFWFVLRHECAHVLHGHGKENPVVDAELDGDVSAQQEPQERIANEEAADFCVPTAKMRSFFLRKNPYFAEKEVIAFAMRMGVHPGLVVGQLHRMLGRYDLLRKHLPKVRPHLASAMMMDGWGDVVPTER